MDLSDLFTPDRVFHDFRAASKKQLLLEMSTLAARPTGIGDREIFESLLERERLGSTGVGQGVAIPHAKLPGLAGLFGFFAKLESPIDFEAIDDRPVDLVMLLLAPDTSGADHLKALARVSRLLRNQSVCEKLRASADVAELYSLVTEPAASDAA